jgi:putative transposase
MQLNGAGLAIQRWWFELRNKFATVETDEFVIMPNHLHGIVVITDTIVGADLCVGPVLEDAHTAHQGAHAGAPLPTVIQWFKTMTTNEYIRGVKTLGWPAFRGRLWQRSYYEHIIRNEKSLNRIWQYTLDNPAHWDADRENPVVGIPERDEA